ncbi:MAG: ABC transporter ATP-binding protein [Sedimenticolaceae bacterium]
MIAIDAHGLGKGYRHYARPVDSLKELVLRRPLHETNWALRGASFQVPRGGTLGVIGANGAGKSTLLKLLAGTLQPSEGRLRVDGRVSAILELGSGFHPEFSGLDNVRMGCAMLGLSAAETRERLPEILDFSELGEAVHRPVKTYSSGMYVRLAFAVVTSVDPDVLIVDEALSVGDQHFQKKSLSRMRGFIEQGKTVVFCSHNLYQVKSLCDQALWLDRGEVRLRGSAEDAVEAYQDYSRELDSQQAPASADAPRRPAAAGASEASITDAVLVGQDADRPFATGDDLELRVEVRSATLTEGDLSLAVVIMRNDNLHVYGSSTEIDGTRLYPTGEGVFGISFSLPAVPLLSGRFSLYLYLLDAEGIHIYDKREDVLPFSVRHEGREVGVSRLPHTWGPG